MPHRLRRSRRVALAMTMLAGLIIATTPVTFAANATNINTILPAGRKIVGTLVSDIDGTPIAGAWISAQSSDYTSYKSTSTGADGKFTLAGLKGGTTLTYSLDIDPDDDKHGPGCYTGANADKYTYACDGFPGPQTPALNTATLNLGTIRAAKGFTISGVVKGGTATTSSPLANVEVALGGDDYDWATTPTNGSFAFKGLAPGTYEVSFETPSTVNYRDGYWNAGTATKFHAMTPTDIVITTANKTNINVILPTGRTVTGYVKTGAGAAIPNAWVNLDGSMGTESAYTDAAGRYVLKGVSNGTDYQLEVEAPYQKNYQGGFYTTSNVNHFIVTPNAGSTIVVNGNETLLDVKLPVGFRVKGKVVGPTGTPVQNAYATAQGPDYGSATTKADGTFEIVGLSPGAYVIDIDPPYYPAANAYGGWFDANTTTYRFTLVEANADKKTLGGSFPLWDIGQVKLRTGHTISGVVKGGTTTTSSVLAGVSVSASGGNGTVFDYASAQTSATGAYTLIGLIPGQYRVSFSPPSTMNYRGGYWKSGALPNWSQDYAGASLVTIGP